MNLTNHESGFSSAIKLDEKFRKISIRSETATISHADAPDDSSLDSDSDLVPTVYFVQGDFREDSFCYSNRLHSVRDFEDEPQDSRSRGHFAEASFCYSDGLHSVHREFREVETHDNESGEHFVEDSFCYSDGLHSVHREFGEVKPQDSDSGGHFAEDSFCGSDGLRSSPFEEIESQVSDSVVDVLKPEEVRWFYKCESDKRWLEFSGYDSLRIEFKYRQLFRAWHNASNIYTEHVPENNSEEPSSVRSALNVETDTEKDISDSRTSTSAIYTPDSDHHIIVRGGMYEVDLQTWKCKSIYWKSEECGITRGIWFYATWQPLEEEYNELIEAEHLGLYCGQKVGDLLLDPACRTNRQAVHTQSYPEFHVDWYSPSEVYLYSEAASSKLVRSFTQKLGFQKSTGYKLYRGFKYPATEKDRPSDISHLVFVIHGIGQKMDTGRIIRNTSAFRDCVAWLKEKYFATSSCRAEFFPVEWRSSLKLDGDIVESITPHKLWTLRQTLNSSAMDIMYYTSPLYGNEVQRGLAAELNRLYAMFSQHNPYFENNGGKVSVIAHSLGCVIVYDIVTGWKVSRMEMHSECNSEISSNQSGLIFQIENLFCLGSPLSVFLALRYRVPEENVLPASLCKRLFNVFHPSDPVAYRMEPLLAREYSRIAPVQIHAYSSASQLPSYTDLPLEPLLPDAVPILPPNRTGSLPAEGGDCPESPGGTPNKDKGWSLWGLMRNWRQDGVGSPHLDASPWGTLPYRLDYVLPNTHAAVSYLYALTSHTAYWNNYDVAYFVLIHLFPQLERELRNQSPPSEEA